MVLIAGPCVIESERLCLRVGETVRRACERLGIQCIADSSRRRAILSP
jgi:3-deoxy-D-manno-octulosonic acid (KDO) 8-phosphate synthase